MLCPVLEDSLSLHHECSSPSSLITKGHKGCVSLIARGCCWTQSVSLITKGCFVLGSMTSRLHRCPWRWSVYTDSWIGPFSTYFYQSVKVKRFLYHDWHKCRECSVRGGGDDHHQCCGQGWGRSSGLWGVCQDHDGEIININNKTSLIKIACLFAIIESMRYIEHEHSLHCGQTKM